MFILIFGTFQFYSPNLFHFYFGSGEIRTWDLPSLSHQSNALPSELSWLDTFTLLTIYQFKSNGKRSFWGCILGAIPNSVPSPNKAFFCCRKWLSSSARVRLEIGKTIFLERNWKNGMLGSAKIWKAPISRWVLNRPGCWCQVKPFSFELVW